MQNSIFDNFVKFVGPDIRDIFDLGMVNRDLAVLKGLGDYSIMFVKVSDSKSFYADTIFITNDAFTATWVAQIQMSIRIPDAYEVIAVRKGCVSQNMTDDNVSAWPGEDFIWLGDTRAAEPHVVCGNVLRFVNGIKLD